jgi:hypothetical protein
VVKVFVGDLVAGGEEVSDGVVHLLSAPDHENVECEPERAEMVSLAFAVGAGVARLGCAWKMTRATEWRPA